jgi:hypothetical protein
MMHGQKTIKLSYAESVRKSKKMPAQLGLTVVPGIMLARLCST